MNFTRFEQDFSWLKTYAHEAKEIADVLVNESDFFKKQILQALEKHGLPEARSVLEDRATGLRAQLTSLERVLAGEDGPLPPRVTLLETEYLRAVTSAELNWICGIVDELGSGALNWSEEELMEAASSFLG